MDKREIDRFQQIAGGGKKKLDCEVKRLKEIPPPLYEKVLLKKCDKQDVVIPPFDENAAYKAFIEEKARLLKHYEPFLADVSERAVCRAETQELVDFYYRKETEEDKLDFSVVASGGGEWEKIKLPKYEGPTGKWNAFYRRILKLGNKDSTKRYLIDFEAVDYIAEVYLNGRLITRHEGFFSPFRRISRIT